MRVASFPNCCAAWGFSSVAVFSSSPETEGSREPLLHLHAVTLGPRFPGWAIGAGICFRIYADKPIAFMLTN